jgi:hypothetical protein
MAGAVFSSSPRSGNAGEILRDGSATSSFSSLNSINSQEHGDRSTYNGVINKIPIESLTKEKKLEKISSYL